MLEDIAILTAGKVIVEEVGLTQEKVLLDDIDQAKRVEVIRKTPRSSAVLEVRVRFRVVLRKSVN